MPADQIQLLQEASDAVQAQAAVGRLGALDPLALRAQRRHVAVVRRLQIRRVHIHALEVVGQRLCAVTGARRRRPPHLAEAGRTLISTTPTPRKSGTPTPPPVGRAAPAPPSSSTPGC
jgi:hypothetical protein